MEFEPRVFRRVVTGNDAEGRSGVLFDSATPNQTRRGTGFVFNEFWTFEEAPAIISGTADGSDRPASVSPPDRGAHFRIVESPCEDDMPDVDAQEAHASMTAFTLTGVTEHRTDGPHWNMHRTATVDYGFVVDEDRVLVLEDSEVLLHKGDVVIQLGTWHSWSNRTDGNGSMAYVMIGGELPD
jgi:hypothetical protein